MPLADLESCRVHYEIAGPTDAPVLVFSHALGADLSMWDRQVEAFGDSYRVLRYDSRGHGQSHAPPGPYTVRDLAKDVLQLLDYVAVSQTNFCGLSMGGMIGQFLGIHHGHRLRRLILSNTGARIGTDESWRQRIDAVQKNGLQQVAGPVLDRWFTPGFRNEHPEVPRHFEHVMVRVSPEGYAACAAAIRDTDLRQDLPKIQARTLVITGTHDTSTPPGDGRLIAQNVTGAHLIELDAAHLSNVECPEEFNKAVRGFLAA